LETRNVRISQITTSTSRQLLGLALDRASIANQFFDAPPLCFSIEIRKSGQTYSTIGALPAFELIYIVADRRRHPSAHNYRKEMSIFTAPRFRQRRPRAFPRKNRWRNALRTKPRWYRAITTNCTTSIRTASS
jgi:hypothetical protein